MPTEPPSLYAARHVGARCREKYATQVSCTCAGVMGINMPAIFIMSLWLHRALSYSSRGGLGSPGRGGQQGPPRRQPWPARAAAADDATGHAVAAPADVLRGAAGAAHL